MSPEYLYIYQIWLIIGIIMIVLEIFDTSTIFFLPLGLSGLMMGLWLGLTEHQIMPIDWVPVPWFWLLTVWAVIGFSFTIILGMVKRIGVENTITKDDVNDY